MCSKPECVVGKVKFMSGAGRRMEEEVRGVSEPVWDDRRGGGGGSFERKPAGESGREGGKLVRSCAVPWWVSLGRFV